MWTISKLTFCQNLTSFTQRWKALITVTKIIKDMYEAKWCANKAKIAEVFEMKSYTLSDIISVGHVEIGGHLSLALLLVCSKTKWWGKGWNLTETLAHCYSSDNTQQVFKWILTRFSFKYFCSFAVFVDKSSFSKVRVNGLYFDMLELCTETLCWWRHLPAVPWAPPWETWPCCRGSTSRSRSWSPAVSGSAGCSAAWPSGTPL